jgi:hypothetical protein
MLSGPSKSLYMPPWPTKLDEALPFEVEHVWESHIGDVVDRLVQRGQMALLRTSRLKDKQRGFYSEAWKKAKRLGAELFDLRGRFRVVYVCALRRCWCGCGRAGAALVPRWPSASSLLHDAALYVCVRYTRRGVLLTLCSVVAPDAPSCYLVRVGV